MEKQPAKKQHKRNLLLGALVILATFAFFISKQTNYMHPNNWTSIYSGKSLQSNETAPLPAIYFVETSGKPYLTIREACSVESAAIHNAGRPVRLLSLAPFSIAMNHMRTLGRVANVEFLTLNLASLFSDTPLKRLAESGEMNSSAYRIHHTSDATRLALLWKLGGIYLDTDTITLRPLAGFQNALGLQYDEDVANGVLFFERHNLFLNVCMAEFARDYQKEAWGHQGPVLVTRVLKQTCNASTLAGVINKPESCQGIRLLPQHDLLPIGWRDWKMILEAKDLGKFNLTGSYMVHLYGYLSRATSVKPGSGVLLDVLAKTNCPQMYKHALRRNVL